MLDQGADVISKKAWIPCLRMEQRRNDEVVVLRKKIIRSRNGRHIKTRSSPFALD